MEDRIPRQCEGCLNLGKNNCKVFKDAVHQWLNSECSAYTDDPVVMFKIVKDITIYALKLNKNLPNTEYMRILWRSNHKELKHEFAYWYKRARTMGVR